MIQCVGTGALAVETAANTMAMILLLLLPYFLRLIQKSSGGVDVLQALSH